MAAKRLISWIQFKLMVFFTPDCAENNRRTLEQLSRGDLVEVDRVFFCHWGVYLGQGYIAHLANNEDVFVETKSFFTNIFESARRKFQGQGHSISGCHDNSSRNAEVVIGSFWDFVSGGRATKNNSIDLICRPLPPDAILTNVQQSLGTAYYGLFTGNCEHFATWCRYGHSFSDQLRGPLTYTVAILGGLLGGWLGVAVAALTALTLDLLLLTVIPHQQGSVEDKKGHKINYFYIDEHFNYVG